MAASNLQGGRVPVRLPATFLPPATKPLLEFYIQEMLCVRYSSTYAGFLDHMDSQVLGLLGDDIASVSQLTSPYRHVLVARCGMLNCFYLCPDRF